MGKGDADAALLQRFVNTFNELDDSIYTHLLPPADGFIAGIDPEDWNLIRWKPACLPTRRSAISAIRIAGPLPRLYEMLALTYRWPMVDLRLLRLLPNEPASDLRPLAAAMFADPVLNNALVPAGYVRFAMAADDYDPICFDLNRPVGDDCPIIRLEHESILMHDRIGAHSTIFPTLRELMLAVIHSAA